MTYAYYPLHSICCLSCIRIHSYWKSVLLFISLTVRIGAKFKERFGLPNRAYRTLKQPHFSHLHLSSISITPIKLSHVQDIVPNKRFGCRDDVWRQKLLARNQRPASRYWRGWSSLGSCDRKRGEIPADYLKNFP
jgi:hypothetical protein